MDQQAITTDIVAPIGAAIELLRAHKTLLATLTTSGAVPVGALDDAIERLLYARTCAENMND